MATLAELRETNANIEQLMNEWRQQRYANGENPLDWAAFRAHVQAAGGPDPGDPAPDEFYRWQNMAGGTPESSEDTERR